MQNCALRRFTLLASDCFYSAISCALKTYHNRMRVDSTRRKRCLLSRTMRSVIRLDESTDIMSEELTM